VIAPDRFIARSSDRELWLAARAEGVTATMAAHASTNAGFAETIARIDDPQPIQSNEYMEWGNFREPFIALEVKDRFGIMPNEWLIAKDSGLERWMMATPDGLCWHDDHKTIAEIKTSGKPLDSIPIRYRRQMQWQMFVTDAERCLFAWELRLEGPEGFVPDFDIHTQWVERDEDMIGGLVKVAQQLQQHFVYRSWDERESMENEHG
jgi:hypothetical protein